MDNYKILGISENADKKEIKRAYFKLVRQYSPEKDPQRFQEIREAYESLMAANDQNADTAFQLHFPTDDFARELRKNIEYQMKHEQYFRAAETASTAMSYYGENEGFLYLLACAQLRAGNTGKAVKSFERLVVLFPEKAVYRRELAFAYLERGFGKKAHQAFQDAYNMGCRDSEFMGLFMVSCRDREDYERGTELGFELSKSLMDTPRDNIDELMNAYAGMMYMGMFQKRDQYQKILESFYQFIQKCFPYLDDFEQSLAELITIAFVRDDLISTDISLLKKIIKTLRNKFQNSGNGLWDALDLQAETRAIYMDNRLSEVLKSGVEAFTEQREDPRLQRYIKRDVQLCLMEEWPEIMDQIQIIRQDYPIYYAALSDFIQTLERTSDIDNLRERFQKDLDRLERDFEGAYYYEQYPHRRRKSQAAAQWDSMEDGTYTRSQPKIGRNDSCPCGSGKKYKNCCLNKQPAMGS